jgi:hypothetical protein
VRRILEVTRLLDSLDCYVSRQEAVAALAEAVEA